MLFGSECTCLWPHATAILIFFNFLYEITCTCQVREFFFSLHILLFEFVVTYICLSLKFSHPIQQVLCTDGAQWQSEVQSRIPDPGIAAGTNQSTSLPDHWAPAHPWYLLAQGLVSYFVAGMCLSAFPLEEFVTISKCMSSLVTQRNKINQS